MSKSMTYSGLALALSILSLPLAAQEVQEEQEVQASGQTSVVTYPADFFAQYSPNTANDMLPWIPGVSLALDNRGPGGGDRGLGGEENILINGERVAGKSNSARGQLGRIPASEVDYIEIIRGAPGDLGVRSGGQIINVVLLTELDTRTVNVEYGLDRDSDGTYRQGATVTYNQQVGRADVTLSAFANPRYELRDSREINFLPDGTPRGTITRAEETDFYDTRLNANLALELSATDRLQLNAQWQRPESPQHIDRVITDLAATPPSRSFETEDTRTDDSGWELGGNYEHRFAGGSIYRALVIASREDEASLRERYQLTAPGGEATKDLVLNTGSVAEERILRSSVTWRIDPAQNLEYGLEFAQNILDSRLALGTLSGSLPPSPATGGLPGVDVDNADSRVEELRLEPFLVHNWQLTPALTVESSLTAEFSEIEQTGGAEKRREFDFLKPGLDIRYNLTDTIQLRGQARKRVSQLDFGQFVASADTNDEQQNTEAGNPELAQEETWRYDAQIEYRLPDDTGVVSSQVYFEDIDNVIDRVDLAPGSLNPIGATGNIGSATRYGFTLDGSLRMGLVGLPQALLTANLRLEDSEVIDPILGVERRLQFSDRGSLRLGWRHDLGALGLNYAINYQVPFNGGRARFDVNRIERFKNDPDLRVVVQKTWLEDVVLELEFSNLFNSERCRERQRFDSRISDPLPTLIEISCSDTGRQLAFKARTTF